MVSEWHKPHHLKYICKPLTLIIRTDTAFGLLRRSPHAACRRWFLSRTGLFLLRSWDPQASTRLEKAPNTVGAWGMESGSDMGMAKRVCVLAQVSLWGHVPKSKATGSVGSRLMQLVPLLRVHGWPCIDSTDGRDLVAHMVGECSRMLASKKPKLCPNSINDNVTCLTRVV